MFSVYAVGPKIGVTLAVSRHPLAINHIKIICSVLYQQIKVEMHKMHEIHPSAVSHAQIQSNKNMV